MTRHTNTRLDDRKTPLDMYLQEDMDRPRWRWSGGYADGDGDGYDNHVHTRMMMSTDTSFLFDFYCSSSTPVSAFPRLC